MLLIDASMLGSGPAGDSGWQATAVRVIVGLVLVLYVVIVVGASIGRANRR